MDASLGCVLIVELSKITPILPLLHGHYGPGGEQEPKVTG